MSKLERLIQQYCPDGVEYVKLDSVANICRGTRVVKSQLSDKGYPVYQNCLTPMGYFERSNCNAGITFVICGGAAGNVGYTDVECWAADDCEFIIGGHQVINRYIYYYLMTKQNYLLSKVRKASIPRLSPSIIKDLEIPLPPLPVQEEIVRILDAFTELQAELQAELQKRKQQYNYYLDNLLSFKNINRGGRAEVRWMKLKDVATQWYRGAGIKREEVSEDGMPCIRYGEIHTTYNIWFDDCISHADESKQVSRKYAEKGDILFAITSEDIPFVGNSVAYLGNERILVGGDIVVMKHNQDPKYMAYALSTSDAIKQKGKGKVKSKVVHTNVPSLQEIVIPIPSIAEQQRIVSILDRFDTLTTDLTQGLPAEIEKRRQQYEYYRDKLLTFKRKEA